MLYSDRSVPLAPDARGVFLGAVAQLGERNAGSVEVRGSNPLSSTEPKWRNRQTRYVQGVVGNSPWEFKSPLRHPDLW
jgi:hypothetical protein